MRRQIRRVLRAEMQMAMPTPLWLRMRSRSRLFYLIFTYCCGGCLCSRESGSTKAPARRNRSKADERVCHLGGSFCASYCECKHHSSPHLPEFIQDTYEFVSFFNGDTEHADPPACGSNPYLLPLLAMVFVLSPLSKCLRWQLGLLRVILRPTKRDQQSGR